MKLKASDHYLSAEAEIGVKASLSVRIPSSAAREANVTNRRHLNASQRAMSAFGALPDVRHLLAGSLV